MLAPCVDMLKPRTLAPCWVGQAIGRQRARHTVDARCRRRRRGKALGLAEKRNEFRRSWFDVVMV